MKVYMYSQHIIAIIISLGQNIGVQNAILPRGLYFFTLFFVVFPMVSYPPADVKTDYIINMALCTQGTATGSQPSLVPHRTLGGTTIIRLRSSCFPAILSSISMYMSNMEEIIYKYF